MNGYKWTKESFLEAVRVKYPDYREWGDDTLFSKLLTKYPDYKPQIAPERIATPLPPEAEAQIQAIKFQPAEPTTTGVYTPIPETPILREEQQRFLLEEIRKRPALKHPKAVAFKSGIMSGVGGKLLEKAGLTEYEREEYEKAKVLHPYITMAGNFVGIGMLLGTPIGKVGAGIAGRIAAKGIIGEAARESIRAAISGSIVEPIQTLSAAIADRKFELKEMAKEIGTGIAMWGVMGAGFGVGKGVFRGIRNLSKIPPEKITPETINKELLDQPEIRNTIFTRIRTELQYPAIPEKPLTKLETIQETQNIFKRIREMQYPPTAPARPIEPAPRVAPERIPPKVSEMTFEKFKKTFTLGTSILKPNGKEPIEIRGYYRGKVMDYPHSGIHKWKVNYGKFDKTYKSFEETMEGVYKDLQEVKPEIKPEARPIGVKAEKPEIKPKLPPKREEPVISEKFVEAFALKRDLSEINKTLTNLPARIERNKRDLNTFEKEGGKVPIKKGEETFYQWASPESQMGINHIENLKNEIEKDTQLIKSLTIQKNQIIEKMTVKPEEAIETEIVKGVKPPEVKPEITPELEPLAIEARKYKSAEEFENTINRAIEKSREAKDEKAVKEAGNMISGIPIGKAKYNYSIAMALDKAGYKNITDFYNQVIKGVKAEAKELEPPKLPPTKPAMEPEKPISFYTELRESEEARNILRRQGASSSIVRRYGAGAENITNITPSKIINKLSKDAKERAISILGSQDPRFALEKPISPKAYRIQAELFRAGIIRLKPEGKDVIIVPTEKAKTLIRGEFRGVAEPKEGLFVGAKEPTKEIFPVSQKTPQELTLELETIRTEATQSGKLTIPIIRTSREIEKNLIEAGVVIEKPVKKSVLDFILPMRVKGMLDKPTSRILEKWRNSFHNYEEGVNKKNVQIDYSFHRITTEELKHLITEQEAGRLTPEFVRQLHPRYQRAINGLQGMNKEIERIAREQFGIDTSKWSFTEYNYFHHAFLGSHALRVDGKIRAIGNLGELYLKTEDLIKQGVPPASIELKPKFEMQEAPTTLLKAPGFWAFVSKWADQLGISGDEVVAEMKGIAGIRPRPIFVGAFRPRTANLLGYEKDPRIVYKILWNRILRKQFLEPTAKETMNMLSEVKIPWLKQDLENYISLLRGKYIEPQYFMGINVSRLGQSLVRGESITKMGYRVSPVALNVTQPPTNAYADFGGYLWKGYGKLVTGKYKSVIEKLNISKRTKLTVGDYTEISSGREKLDHPLGAFSFVENKINRGVVGATGYDYGINVLKLSEKDAIRLGNAANLAHNFEYSLTDAPSVFRHPLARVPGQFKTFAINYVVNAYHILTGKPTPGLEEWFPLMFPTRASRVMRATRFLGANLAVGGVRTISGLALPINMGFISYLAIKHPHIMQGAFSYLGIDLSKRAGASPFEIVPQDVGDLLGVPAGDLQRIVKSVRRWEKTGDLRELIQILRIAPVAWNIYQALSATEEVEITPKERILLGMGFQPSRLSTIAEGMRYIKYARPEYYTRTLFLPTKQAIENMVYNVVENKDYNPKYKEVALEILNLSGITKDKYQSYLLSRQSRLSTGAKPKRLKLKELGKSLEGESLESL